jgi:DNA-binding response OmpR family regulator
MLPGVDGGTICKDARAEGVTTPIIILTARDETDTKVELLNIGADDYIAKPFSFEELVARITAVLRRPLRPPHHAHGARHRARPWPPRRREERKSRPLTLKEYSLLEFFMRHPDEALTRETIMDHVWSFDFPGFSNVLDVHMKNLRKKLDTYETADPLFRDRSRRGLPA